MRARSAEEIQELLRGIERVGRLSDGLIRIGRGPFRIGLDPVLNFIPGLGPVYTSVTGLYLLIQAWRAHVPAPTLAAMWVCMAVDGVAGSIPVAGLIGDFLWRGHAKAARLAADAIRRNHVVDGFAGQAHPADGFAGRMHPAASGQFRDALRGVFSRVQPRRA